MRVKLSKVIKDLNVGMQTIQDFFAKKKIELDVTPNTKIDEDIQHVLTNLGVGGNIYINLLFFKEVLDSLLSNIQIFNNLT